jgi:hypothetical protein
VETSYRSSAHELLPASAWIFLIVRRAGGDLSLFPDECCDRQQRVENLQPYADWVVIGPVSLSNARVARTTCYLWAFRPCWGSVSVPRPASAP